MGWRDQSATPAAGEWGPIYSQGVSEPEAKRPYMPGYGVGGPDEGTGLLPWSWATERLTSSHDYWVATVRPTAGPT